MELGNERARVSPCHPHDIDPDELRKGKFRFGMLFPLSSCARAIIVARSIARRISGRRGNTPSLSPPIPPFVPAGQSALFLDGGAENSHLITKSPLE